MPVFCVNEVRAVRPDPAHAAALACLRSEAPAAARTLQEPGVGALRYGGRTSWFRGGEDCLGAMLTQLRGARSCVWLELGRALPGVVWDTVLTALRQRAARGTDVRLILGPRCLLPGLRELRHMRIRWIRRGPRSPGADLLVIDGRVCYAGALAMRDDWAGLRSSRRGWLAPCLRLEGPAAQAAALRFCERWRTLTGQAPPAPAPAGPDGYCYALPLDGQGLRTAVRSMVGRAERSVCLLRGSPDPVLAEALRLAARTGVEVRVLTPFPMGLPAGCAFRCGGKRVGVLACCADGNLAAVGGRAGGLWLFGDGAAGLEEVLNRMAVRRA